MTTPSDPLSVGSTSSSLIRKVTDNDQDAWTRMVRLYGPLVDHWLAKANLRGPDAEGVFQEVFTAIAGGIATFRKDRPGDTFRGWLRTIVRSKVVDHLRAQANQPQAAGGSEAQRKLLEVADPQLPEWDESDDDQPLRELRDRALEQIRGEFEKRTWEMFWRVAIEEDSTADVAEDIGVTPSAVRMAKSRVVRRLREELGDLDS